MSLFGENRFKNLTAEYVEEKLALESFPNPHPAHSPNWAKLTTYDLNKQSKDTQKTKESEAKDVSVNDDTPVPEAVEEAKDVSVNDDFDVESVDEASYIDALLEALDD